MKALMGDRNNCVGKVSTIRILLVFSIILSIESTEPCIEWNNKEEPVYIGSNNDEKAFTNILIVVSLY